MGYKVSGLARDFGITSKEITEIFGKYPAPTKGTASAMSDDELDVVFSCLIKSKGEVVLDQYLSKMGDAWKAPKEEPVKPIEKVVEAPVAEVASVSQKVKAVENKSEAAKPVQNIQQNSQQGQNTQQNRPQWQNNQQNRPQGQNTQQIRPQGQNVQQNRPQGQNTQQNRPQWQNNQQNRPQVPNNQTQINRQPSHPQAPAVNNAAGRGNQLGVTQEKNLNPQRRIVDTRAAEVNLEKYDERLETFVPDKLQNTNASNKQKLKKGNKRGFNRPNEREIADKLKRKLELEKLKIGRQKVSIPEEITVQDLALRMNITVKDIIKKLFTLGVAATPGQIIDFDTAAIVADEFQYKIEKEVVVTIEDKLLDDTEDDVANLKPRDPVVVVMGHVDHGKTSILDAIRNADVVSGEAGGITQHIGAYRVAVKGGKRITFLDTPGHEAFTAMRARGAQITDIAIIVIAADDGIMPQTVEAINHAKAAGVSIIIAMNKMDKVGANPDHIKQQLTEYELVAEEWGGDTICVPVSAHTRQGIDELLEMILLVAEMKDLKANPTRAAKGTVIEAKIDKGRGPVATILIQNGTLKNGDVVIAGSAVGRIRAMTNDNGKKVDKAGPSVPVEIIGLAEVPLAGDVFYAVEDERMARELSDQRKHQEKEEQFNVGAKVSLEDLFNQLKEGAVKELAIIVKADVQGSVEAVRDSLEKLTNEEVHVHVIHGGVGAINESDIMLATASNAIVVGFNVRPNAQATESAERNGVDMRMYRVIYDAIDEITSAMKGMLTPKFKEEIFGHAEVRQVFKITGAGVIAGSYVTDGKIVRNCEARLVRNGIVITQDKIDSLKRFKDDAKDVQQGFECGIGFAKYNDIKEGDIIEAYEMKQLAV